MSSQSSLSAVLSKETGIFGLKLRVLIGLCVGAFIVLILCVLSLWITFRRKSRTTLEKFSLSQIPNVSKDIRVDRIEAQNSHDIHDNVYLNINEMSVDQNSEKMLVHLGMNKSSDAETLSQCSSVYHHERTYSSHSGDEGSSGTFREHASYGLASASPLIGLPEISHLGWGHWFTLRDLEVATNRFSSENVIGEGGYGVVYRGKLINGTEVAVTS